MTKKLVADELIAQARAATGLERFDAETFREGLEIYLADINRIEFLPGGLEATAGVLIGSLAGRLKIANYLEQRPELLQREIKRPVFVMGFPRTGTTLLNNLLAVDPARRSPLAWEIDDPVPPATTKTLRSDLRALIRLEQERQAKSMFPSMFKYYRGSATYPNECVFIMQQDMKALALESRGKLPNYRDWLYNEADMVAAYQYHKKFLQVLQADAPGTWNLKMPSHALWIDALLAVYPDARLVWTHRDPLAALGSYCSLLRFGQQHSRVAQIDTQYLGENCLWQGAQHLNRLMDARDRLGEDRVIDVYYGDLIRQPVETMRQLYKALGDDFTDTAETGMNAWLADNPQDKFGRHEYKLAEFGITPEQARGSFERYLSRYSIESEGK